MPLLSSTCQPPAQAQCVGVSPALPRAAPWTGRCRAQRQHAAMQLCCSPGQHALRPGDLGSIQQLQLLPHLKQMVLQGCSPAFFRRSADRMGIDFWGATRGCRNRSHFQRAGGREMDGSSVEADVGRVNLRGCSLRECATSGSGCPWSRELLFHLKQLIAPRTPADKGIQ